MALCGSLDSKHNGVGYHLSFEDGRDDPDGAQHPDGSHRQGDSRQLSRWQSKPITLFSRISK